MIIIYFVEENTRYEAPKEIERKLQQANSRNKQFVNNTLNEDNLQKLDSTHQMNKHLVQNDIQVLVNMLERDQIEKEIGNLLKTTFLSCNYTDEGFADKLEFQDKIKN